MPTCSKCSDADLGRVCPHRQTLLITGEALDNFYAWVREAQQLRSTLADLIAELRDAVNDYPPDVFPDFTTDDPASASRTVDRISGVAMRHAWTRAAEMADRTEARLREVTGDAPL